MLSATRPPSSICWAPTDLGASAAGHRDHGGGIGDGRATGIVIEIDVRLIAWFRGRQPFAQCRPPVSRPRLGPALVHPDIPPTRRGPQRTRRPALTVGPAQRGPVLFQHLARLVGEPGLVAWLDNR